jgi:hypothetical protein
MTTPGTRQGTARRYNSMDLANHPPQYKRSQSRNSSPTQRSLQVNYTTRRAHFDTVSDTASSTSSGTSPTKTFNSDAGRYPGHTFQLTSPVTRSTRSNDSNGIILKRETINSVKKTIEGEFFFCWTEREAHT